MSSAKNMIFPEHLTGTVMTDGMMISMQNPNNPNCLSLNIKTGKGLLRHYTWNGGTRSAILRVRSEMWNGHYGAYTPSYEWQFHDGINNLIAEEAVLNFRDYDHLRCAFSAEHDNCRLKYFDYTPGDVSIEDIKKMDFKNILPSWLGLHACSAYTDDGLFVSASKAEGPGDGGTLYVTIFRLLVNSAPVKDLPGNNNKRLSVTYKGE